MSWTVSYHQSAVAEAVAQPQDIRARLERFVMLIVEHGPERLPPKAAKHLRADLWELRLKGRDGIARAFYVTRKGRQLVIVRIFTKKTQATPPSELKLALKRARELS